MNSKQRAAHSAVSRIRSGQVLGLGTGSTARCALEALAERIRQEKLDVIGVPTSLGTERECQRLGIPLTTLERHPVIDLAIDGADQVDAQLQCIKGYGGALLREKIVARAAQRFIVIVDASKLATTLDKPVPVEVLPFGLGVAQRALGRLGEPELRRRDDQAFTTDNGNFVLDVDCGAIDDPGAVAARLADVPGVVGHGLFVDLAHEVHVGDDKAARVLTR